MSVLFCDSNCELWYNYIDEYNIKFISMPYTLDDNEYYYDLGRNTNFKDYYDKVRNKSIPKTSALNAHNYYEYFEPYMAKNEDILYITFSHKMSATFEQMNIALGELKEKYPTARIEIYDTQLISIAAGIIVLETARMMKAGKSIDEILSVLPSIQKHTFCAFTVNNLMHLYRGGRLARGQAIVGTIFNIKPIIGFNDGKLVSWQKASGRKKALSMLTDNLKKYEVDLQKEIWVLHADCIQDALLVEDKLISEYGDKAIIKKQMIGPVVGSHCGPDTVGVAFSTLNEVKR